MEKKTEIAENIARVRERIEKACLRSGRDSRDVRLMGVSKFQDIAKIVEAWQGGLRLFGESRVQEAAAKCADFRRMHPEMELHLIGPLQRNKAKAAVSLFDWIQSADREVLISALGGAADRPLSLLLEMRTGEDTKTGFPDIESVYRAVDAIGKHPQLRIRGLMTIAPYTEDQRLIRRAFRSVVSARDALAVRFPSCDWSCLSMGMSGDFETAIEEGSTLVRIGTALFGSRV
ncbi:MAG: YggS family pyridoxal phosphate-dependent enzyme [Spirochaetaceae bacterium]|jgi:pyridoxal phosphate enzyme (YggS family)|nr:YggS family pyridoxal phosphate-dependent enzyme [Spirochaetaceae bacterium]